MSKVRMNLQFFGGRGSSGGKNSGGGGGGSASGGSLTGKNGETLPAGTPLKSGEWKRTTKGITVTSSDGTKENIPLEGKQFKRGKEYTSRESLERQMNSGKMYEGTGGLKWRQVTSYTEYVGSKTGERYLLEISSEAWFRGKFSTSAPSGSSKKGIVQRVWRIGK